MAGGMVDPPPSGPEDMAMLTGDLAGHPSKPVDMVMPPGRTLIWHDEFDGNAGDPPDPSKWNFDVGGSGWGNAQLEYDTARPENVSLDGQGHLSITARAEAYMGRSYTSGRIETGSHFNHLYGRFEASMKVPRGQGMWPAFWLLGNTNGTGWPQCGENDIVETRGQDPNTVNGTVHGPGYSGAGGITSKHNVAGNPLWDDFHTYVVEWFPNHVVFSVDGITYATISPTSLNGNQWVFDHPFQIILDLAVGGNFVGSPDGTTPFPQSLLVDYVRVYEALQ
jgi:beta-glucanase (GH16 family)